MSFEHFGDVYVLTSFIWAAGASLFLLLACGIRKWDPSEMRSASVSLSGLPCFGIRACDIARLETRGQRVCEGLFATTPIRRDCPSSLVSFVSSEVMRYSMCVTALGY